MHHLMQQTKQNKRQTDASDILKHQISEIYEALM